MAEQLIMFETLKQNFENSFISHITSIFELQVGLALHAAPQNPGRFAYSGKIVPAV